MRKSDGRQYSFSEATECMLQHAHSVHIDCQGAQPLPNSTKDLVNSLIRALEREIGIYSQLTLINKAIRGLRDTLHRQTLWNPVGGSSGKHS